MNLIEARLDRETARERENERAMPLLLQPGCFFFLLGSTLGDFLGCLSCSGSATGRGSLEKREVERVLQFSAPHKSGSESGREVNTRRKMNEIGRQGSGLTVIS